MMNETFKLPRLFTAEPLNNKGVIALTESQAHYLFNVLRRKNGDMVRIFNGMEGEWLGELTDLSKKSANLILQKELIPQPKDQIKIHLIFAPIKKNRMDWLIEKAVELGATDFHPIVTQNTEVRVLKNERITQQIFEAAEQCERLEIPRLHELEKLDVFLKNWPKDIEIFSCLERMEAKPLSKAHQDVAVLIGPEGGFTQEERDILSNKTTPISLGTQILRSETAVVKALSVLTA